MKVEDFVHGLGLNYYRWWWESNIRNGRETETRWPQAASPPFQSRRKSVNQSYFCAQMVCFGNRHKQDSSGNCNTARGVTHLQQTKTTPLFFDTDRLTRQAWRTLWFLQLQKVKPCDKTTNTASSPSEGPLWCLQLAYSTVTATLMLFKNRPVQPGSCSYLDK